MSEKKLLESLNRLDEDMIEAADSFFVRKGGKSMLKNITVAAAGILLIGGVFFTVLINRSGQTGNENVPETIVPPAVQTSEAVEEGSTDEALSAGMAESAPGTSSSAEQLAEDVVFFVTKEPADPEDKDLIAFCEKKKIQDPSAVSQLHPNTFPEDCGIKLFEYEGDIWGVFNGKVTPTALNRQEMSVNAIPGAAGDPQDKTDLTSAALADYDESGVPEVYYTTGVGTEASSLIVYYPDRPAVLQNEYYVYSDMYNLLHLTHYVRSADDQCFRMLNEKEGRMVSEGDDGELRVYTGYVEEQDGRRITRRQELIIDSFGESLVRESMLWNSSAGKTDSISAEADYSALHSPDMPQDVVFGMSPEEVQERTVMIPDEILYDEANGITGLTYSSQYSFADQDGQQVNGTLTRTLFFDGDSGLTLTDSKTDWAGWYEQVQSAMENIYHLQPSELSGTPSLSEKAGAAEGLEWSLPNGTEVVLTREASGKVSLSCFMKPEGYESMRAALARQAEALPQADSDPAILPDAVEGKLFITCYPDIQTEERLKDGYLLQGEPEQELLQGLAEAEKSAVLLVPLTGFSNRCLGPVLAAAYDTAMVQVVGENSRIVLAVTPEGYGKIWHEWHNEKKERTFRQYVITDRNAVWSIGETIKKVKEEQESDRLGALAYVTNQEMIYIYDYQRE